MFSQESEILEFSNSKPSYPIHQVLRSVNFSATPSKFSNSRPLTYTDQSESMNNIQLSLSSDNSAKRSRSGSLSLANKNLFGMAGGNELNTTNNTSVIGHHQSSMAHETSTFNQLKDRSEKKFATIQENAESEQPYSTFKRQSDKKPSQLVSPVQEIFQSKVSEFYFQERSNLKLRNNKSPQQSLSVANKSARGLGIFRSDESFHDRERDRDRETDLSKKMAFLIKENEKLLHINEELMNELETVRKHGFKMSQISSNQYEESRLIDQLKQELAQMSNKQRFFKHLSQQRYISINENYKQQIQNLQNIIQEQNNKLKGETINVGLKLQMKSLGDQVNNQLEEVRYLSQELDSHKQEINRLIDENQMLQQNVHILGEQKNQWQSKLNIILDENERLNQILAERLMQADGFNQTALDLKNQINSLKKQQQESLLDHQFKINELIQRHEAQMQSKNKEVIALQHLLEENQNYTREHINANQLRDRLRDLENQVIEKNEQVSQLTNQFRIQDAQVATRMQTYKDSIKLEFKAKYKEEVLKVKDQLKNHYQNAVNQLQSQLEAQMSTIHMLNAENESLKIFANEQQILRNEKIEQEEDYVKKYKKIWEEERQIFHRELQRLTRQNQKLIDYIDGMRNDENLQPLHSNRDQRMRSISSVEEQQSLKFKTKSIPKFQESLGLRSKYEMLEENKKLNKLILERCTDLLNKQFR